VTLVDVGHIVGINLYVVHMNVDDDFRPIIRHFVW
jgi:hypothetical protein